LKKVLTIIGWMHYVDKPSTVISPILVGLT